MPPKRSISGTRQGNYAFVYTLDTLKDKPKKELSATKLFNTFAENYKKDYPDATEQQITTAYQNNIQLKTWGNGRKLGTATEALKTIKQEGVMDEIKNVFSKNLNKSEALEQDRNETTGRKNIEKTEDDELLKKASQIEKIMKRKQNVRSDDFKEKIEQLETKNLTKQAKESYDKIAKNMVLSKKLKMQKEAIAKRKEEREKNKADKEYHDNLLNSMSPEQRKKFDQMKARNEDAGALVKLAKYARKKREKREQDEEYERWTQENKKISDEEKAQHIKDSRKARKEQDKIDKEQRVQARKVRLNNIVDRELAKIANLTTPDEEPEYKKPTKKNLKDMNAKQKETQPKINKTLNTDLKTPVPTSEFYKEEEKRKKHFMFSKLKLTYRKPSDYAKKSKSMLF